jgi:2-oxoisovalerate dehydrogenase E1 component
MLVQYNSIITNGLKALQVMYTCRALAQTYEQQKHITKYVHSTSAGHEAIQIAIASLLKPTDWLSPYYRDDAMLITSGFTPYEIMLQLLAKANDPFSGGRSYYGHPSNKDGKRINIIHQSSATGMQAIPTTGIAQGIQYLQQIKLFNEDEAPIVVCSLGDGSVTEGEVAEALQFAALKQLPIIYVVQDNDWGISATSSETRCMDAYEYAAGFPGIERIRVNGTDYFDCYEICNQVTDWVRIHRKPYLIHAKVPLLNHHTSGVRKEFYRTAEDLQKHQQQDPILFLEKALLQHGVDYNALIDIKHTAEILVQDDFKKALESEDPLPSSALTNIFAPTPITKEQGVRAPAHAEKILMVDAALFAIEELMHKHPEIIFFGQDVGKRLGGVFREAATLADKFGEHRVYNTAIQEAYITGATAGLCAVGVKPIVEVQFADYIYPAINQLVTELSKSYYLTNGKFNIQMILRVPIGAYGGGGPYHSGSIESTLCSIKGIKVIYPSNAADMKGLMKAAFYDPNPVVMLEHKGLYWSKVPGTEQAKTIQPDGDYIIPIGRANMVQYASKEAIDMGESMVIITYGMGIYWSLEASKIFAGNIEIIDLRTLQPYDKEAIINAVKKHGKCLLVTEEQITHSVMQSIAGVIGSECFSYLDAPVKIIGAADIPAIPINIKLEKEVLPTAEKLRKAIDDLLNY